ncbi:MAG: hypothetical protein HGA45_38700, partial [Chloroflexales bacterium]|nr:hypothetical protein [Chloroflexales bacterium]
PWGLIPTLWVSYLIVEAQPGWLAAGSRLLPVAQRRALTARAQALQGRWERLSGPWREEGASGSPMYAAALLSPAWGEGDDPLGAAPEGPGDGRLPLSSITVGEIAGGDNLLIVGNRGSGKTTLLQAIVARRATRCYVLDPHNHPGKWPTRVIGGGRDFAAIYAALQKSEQELTSRARQLNADAGARFAPFTLASDEWGSITSEVSTGKDQDSPCRLMLRLLKEGRKFGISFIGCAHGDTAESLGSRGDTVAFRASFDWIVYCGAFVAPQLRDMPNVVRQLPLGRTPEGGTFPLLVVAVSPVTGERRLLDLRGIERPAPAPAPAMPEAAAPAATVSLDTQPLGQGEPAEPTPSGERTTERAGSTLPDDPEPRLGPDARTDTSAPPLPALQSREDLVRLLVQAGWGVTQIRDVVKGTNAEIGALVRQIEDERLRATASRQPAD